MNTRCSTRGVPSLYLSVNSRRAAGRDVHHISFSLLLLLVVPAAVVLVVEDVVVVVVVGLGLWWWVDRESITLTRSGNGRNLFGMLSYVLRPIITALMYFELLLLEVVGGGVGGTRLVTRAKYAISRGRRGHGRFRLLPMPRVGGGVVATIIVVGGRGGIVFTLFLFL